MILISVKSEVQDTKRQFETDKAAEKYLKSVKDIHDLHRKQRMGKRPVQTKNTRADALLWDEKFKRCIPLKVEIINTNHAQLNLKSQLK